MCIVVSIRDDGTGIDSEIQPKLFTKFATKSESGLGLGLYISKNIIEAHGGMIWGKFLHTCIFYARLSLSLIILVLDLLK